MAEDGKIKIDKFDGYDFGSWKMQIEDYLYQKKLHKPLGEAKLTVQKTKVGVESKTKGKSSRTECSKPIASNDKEVNMASDNTLASYIKNIVDDRIMDFGALFHATYYKEELESWERQKLRVQFKEEFVRIEVSTETMVMTWQRSTSSREIEQAGTLRLSKDKYIGKVLEKSNMKDAEARCQPLGDQFKFSKKQAPKTATARRRMAKLPYASTVGSVMYAMVCTRPDIAHAVRVVSRFMSTHEESIGKQSSGYYAT
ncbi:hypothetical protein Tco_0807032 [Tanacetum coccineum]